jgi:chorismate mutase-like protein
MDIQQLRNKIDQLDDQLVRLLSERAAAAAAIGELKAKQGTPIYEPQREQDVINHVRGANPGPLTDLQVQHVYERIMDVMRELQRPHSSAAKH